MTSRSSCSLILMSIESVNAALAMIVPTAPDPGVAITTVANPAIAVPTIARDTMCFLTSRFMLIPCLLCETGYEGERSQSVRGSVRRNAGACGPVAGTAEAGHDRNIY